MEQKKCPFDSPGRNFAFLEAADVVFASELVDLGSITAVKGAITASVMGFLLAGNDRDVWSRIDSY